MNSRATSRCILAGACMIAGMGWGGGAIAEENLREVFFHDLAKTRIGNMTIVQSNPETEVLVFSGGELVLQSGNLIVIARRARIDADTTIRAFTQTVKFPKPGRPNQAARGIDGMEEGANGGNGAPGGPGVSGDEGAPAGKVVLRIGQVAAKGRFIVDLSGQGGGKGQDGGQGGDGGNGRNGRARMCDGGESQEPQDGGDGGWGGIGGQGGPGGRGGNGGIVVYSEALAPLIASKHFVVRTAGGVGGAGGNPGDPGTPGKGGLGGAGIIGCGAGGSDGAPGGRTTGAQPGRTGAPGTAGTAIQEQAP